MAISVVGFKNIQLFSISSKMGYITKIDSVVVVFCECLAQGQENSMCSNICFYFFFGFIFYLSTGSYCE